MYEAKQKSKSRKMRPSKNESIQPCKAVKGNVRVTFLTQDQATAHTKEDITAKQEVPPIMSLTERTMSPRI